LFVPKGDKRTSVKSVSTFSSQKDLAAEKDTAISTTLRCIEKTGVRITTKSLRTNVKPASTLLLGKQIPEDLATSITPR